MVLAPVNMTHHRGVCVQSNIIKSIKRNKKTQPMGWAGWAMGAGSKPQQVASF
jgi:hypothetical protein